MTPPERGASADLRATLAFQRDRGPLSHRKRVLFVAACMRMVCNRVPDGRGLAAVEVVERVVGAALRRNAPETPGCGQPLEPCRPRIGRPWG